MQASLAQTFNAAAAAAYEAFPEKLARLAVIIPHAEAPLYVSPQVASELTTDTAALKKALQEIWDEMHAIRADGIAEQRHNLAGTPVKLIALLDSEEIHGALPDRFTPEMRMFFTLNHEIGHQILSNGHYPLASSHLAESAADTFATLRHLQLFGMDTGLADYLCDSRSSFIVLDTWPEHYSMASIQRAFEVAEEMGETFLNLPLQETAALAAKIADENHLAGKTLTKIHGAFSPVREIFKPYANGTARDPSQYHMDICLKALSVMEENRDDPDIFTAGKRFLTSGGRKEFLTETAGLLGYWKEKLDFINTYEPKVPPKPPHHHYKSYGNDQKI